MRTDTSNELSIIHQYWTNKIKMFVMIRIMYFPEEITKKPYIRC